MTTKILVLWEGFFAHRRLFAWKALGSEFLTRATGRTDRSAGAVPRVTERLLLIQGLSGCWQNVRSLYA